MTDNFELTCTICIRKRASSAEVANVRGQRDRQCRWTTRIRSRGCARTHGSQLRPESFENPLGHARSNFKALHAPRENGLTARIRGGTGSPYRSAGAQRLIDTNKSRSSTSYFHWPHSRASDEAGTVRYLCPRNALLFPRPNRFLGFPKEYHHDHHVEQEGARIIAYRGSNLALAKAGDSV